MKRLLHSIAPTSLCLFLAMGQAQAVGPGAHVEAGLELSTESFSQLTARTQPSIRLGKAPLSRTASWSKFAKETGSAWMATWDRATAVPRRLYGEGLSAPNSVSSANAAAAFARAFLERHIELLAPGASTSDFVLTANRERNGVRVVGFVQTHRGIRVHSGQVSFRFKNDRLVVIGSEALPDVRTTLSRSRLPTGAAEITSARWLLEDAQSVSAADVGDMLILPIVGNDRVIAYKSVVPVTMSSLAPLGKWVVYVDAASGEPVAREQTILFADGEVRFNAPARLPTGERIDYLVPDTALVVNGLDFLTNPDGTLTWDGDSPASLVLRALGLGVDVNNIDGGEDATASFTIAPNGSVVWDARDDELIDAQLTAYVHTQLVKQFARVLVPDLEFLDVKQIVNVNINESCNAFSDGTTINFFQSSPQCANTALLADVVYHEYGHALHSNSVIEGVGFFNGAHSEGLSDYLAAAITGDPAMARGFFRSDAPLRHIDPSDTEARWPDDIAGVHTTGLIFSGAMWDLRKLLIQKLGEAEGAAHTDKLWYATLERATDIPSTYVEVLLEDDDDGNLANGTPNACDINAAFGPHGLRNLDIQLSPLASELPGNSYPVSVSLSGLFEDCPGDQIETVALAWRLQSADIETELETIPLTENDGVFEGAIPAAPDGEVVNYAVQVQLADLTRLTFPDNPADQLYQFYVGETVNLFCTDFSTDPFSEGWSHGVKGGTPESRDDWTWGVPAAPSGAQDPPSAFVGEFVVGNDLGGLGANGRYSADTANFLKTPVIELENYTDVHLQYRRWLTVEDGFFDTAAIFANGSLAWSNANSDMGNSSSIHHEDREWRFHDVAISRFAKDKAIELDFTIDSDAGLELGGWTIDDFCIVANVNSICGDANLTGAETCDDGSANSDSEPNACRTDCKIASCGDGVVDNSEQCDDGNDVEGDDCDNVCQLTADSGGCCQASGTRGNGGSIALLLAVVLGLTYRRRRRDRAQS